jgi:hypothetical protein
MHCILGYQNPIVGISTRTQARKGLISYYKTNGITFLKRNMDVDHFFIAQMFEEEVNSVLRNVEER